MERNRFSCLPVACCRLPEYSFYALPYQTVLRYSKGSSWPNTSKLNCDAVPPLASSSQHLEICGGQAGLAKSNTQKKAYYGGYTIVSTTLYIGGWIHIHASNMGMEMNKIRINLIIKHNPKDHPCNPWISSAGDGDILPAVCNAFNVLHRSRDWCEMWTYLSTFLCPSKCYIGWVFCPTHQQSTATSNLNTRTSWKFAE